MLTPVRESVPEPTFVRPPPTPEKMPANVPEVASPRESVLLPRATTELATPATEPSEIPEPLMPEMLYVAPEPVSETVPLVPDVPGPERASVPAETVVRPE